MKIGLKTASRVGVSGAKILSVSHLIFCARHPNPHYDEESLTARPASRFRHQFPLYNHAKANRMTPLRRTNVQDDLQDGEAGTSSCMHSAIMMRFWTHCGASDEMKHREELPVQSMQAVCFVLRSFVDHVRINIGSRKSFLTL